MDTRRVVCVSVRKILEKLKSLCSLRRLHMAPVAEAGEAASSTREQGRALSAENDAGARGTFDDTWQGGPKDAAPFWHDEGGPDRWASAVVDEMGPRRRPADAPTLSIVCGWSGDTRDLALGYILMDSVKATDKRFEVEVDVAPADNSLQIRCVDALSLGKNRTTSWSLAGLNTAFSGVSKSWGPCSGLQHELGCWIWRWVRACRVRRWQLRGSPGNAVPWGALGIVSDQELHPN